MDSMQPALIVRHVAPGKNGQPVTVTVTRYIYARDSLLCTHILGLSPRSAFLSLVLTTANQLVLRPVIQLRRLGRLKLST